MTAADHANTKHLPSISMHVVSKPGKPGRIVMTERPWRSKYVTIVCFCKRRRKDGSCQITDALTCRLIAPERARIKHPDIDDQRFPVRVS